MDLCIGDEDTEIDYADATITTPLDKWLIK